MENRSNKTCFEAEIKAKFLSFFNGFHLDKSKRYGNDMQTLRWKEEITFKKHSCNFIK